MTLLEEEKDLLGKIPVIDRLAQDAHYLMLGELSQIWYSYLLELRKRLAEVKYLIKIYYGR